MPVSATYRRVSTVVAVGVGVLLWARDASRPPPPVPPPAHAVQDDLRRRKAIYDPPASPPTTLLPAAAPREMPERLELAARGVAVVYGVVKGQVQYARQQLDVLEKGLGAAAETALEILDGRRNVLFGDTFLPGALFVLGTKWGADLAAQRATNFVARRALTPVAVLVALRLNFPNTWDHTAMHIDNLMTRMLGDNRGNSAAGPQRRAQAVEEPITEAVALSTNPETQAVVRVDRDHADDNDVRDMYTVRSRDIGGPHPSESESVDTPAPQPTAQL